jgi:hypothetical protein
VFGARQLDNFGSADSLADVARLLDPLGRVAQPVHDQCRDLNEGSTARTSVSKFLRSTADPGLAERRE